MFAQLNTKTEYSFLDSTVRIDTYISQAKRLGYQQIGICDLGNLHGAHQFLTQALAQGIQPILGFETTLEVDSMPVGLIFIAKNTQGYHHLLKLSSRINFGQREFSQLTDLMEGLALVSDREIESLATYDTYTRLDLEGDNPRQMRRPLAMPSVRYLSGGDRPVLEILHAIRDGQKFDSSVSLSSRENLGSPDFYESYFSEKSPGALANLEALVANIQYDLSETLQLPSFDKSRPADHLLREEAYAGLRNRGISDKPYQARLDHELAIIHQMGFDDYFLIVGDLLGYARENHIYCGMGRGSAAGSLVAYALQITHVDPVANSLLFERFLNPERVAMPDIDIDMPDDKRSDLLAYMKNKYGSDHVAQIVTFSTFGKRQALRDVGKVFGLTETDLSSLTRGISRFGSLDEEYNRNPRFKAELLKNPLLHQIFDFAKKIEGLPRQTSTHASGVVLAEESLTNYTPLKPGDDMFLTQFEAPDIEKIGLLKMDFLGLRNLTLIEEMRDLVQKSTQTRLDPLKIDLEDPDTLALFRDGNTLGIFQFENPQMRRFLRQLAPSEFNDLVNATSIFRPGPSQFIPQFIARRHGKEAIPSLDPSISDILAPTYGIMIYQEQVMLVAVEFAGFSMGRADSLRRAISKKQGRDFDRLEAEFIQGAIQKNHSANLAKEIYDLIVRFANYGFNRSHAYAYAALAFQIAYFKAHYPAEFYEVHFKSYKRELMLADALDNGYQLIRPDINTMPYYDKVRDGQIYLGLKHIAGFSRDLAIWILENRPFSNLEDLVRRLPEHWQKEELIRPLIMIGAFDQTDSNRGKLLANLSNLLAYHQTFQLDLFEKSQLKFSYQEMEDLDANERYKEERSLLGIAVTPHPLNIWATRLSGQYTRFSDLIEKQRVAVLGEILFIRVLTTKKSERMAFVEMTDTKQNLTLVVFPEAYRANFNQLEKGRMYLVTGKVETREGEVQIQANQFVQLYDTHEKLWISTVDQVQHIKIAALLKKYPGPHPVILHEESSKLTQDTGLYVEKSDRLLKSLGPLTQKAIFK